SETRRDGAVAKGLRAAEVMRIDLSREQVLGDDAPSGIVIGADEMSALEHAVIDEDDGHAQGERVPERLVLIRAHGGDHEGGRLESEKALYDAALLFRVAVRTTVSELVPHRGSRLLGGLD